MLSEALRELVVVLAAADQASEPEPLPLGGLQVSQVAVLVGVQVQPALQLTVTLPLVAAAPIEALGAERL